MGNVDGVLEGKMATSVTSGKRPYKQVPIRKYFNAPRLYLAAGGTMAVGWLWWSHKWRKLTANRTESRSVELALQPMLSAERDRQFLKRIVQNREWEAELMKDVKDWEVGTYFGKPVYRTMDGDDETDNKFHHYSPYEYFMHASSLNSFYETNYHNVWLF